MRVPKRYIDKLQPEKSDEKIVSTPATSDETKVLVPKSNVDDLAEVRLLNEIKAMLKRKKSPPVYVFTVQRDNDGRMIQVVARPVEQETIL